MKALAKSKRRKKLTFREVVENMYNAEREGRIFIDPTTGEQIGLSPEAVSYWDEAINGIGEEERLCDGGRAAFEAETSKGSRRLWIHSLPRPTNL
jgi:hypothetical protein